MFWFLSPPPTSIQGVCHLLKEGCFDSTTMFIFWGGGGSKIDNFWNKNKSPKSVLIATKQIKPLQHRIPAVKDGDGVDKKVSILQDRTLLKTYSHCPFNTHILPPSFNTRASRRSHNSEFLCSRWVSSFDDLFRTVRKPYVTHKPPSLFHHPTLAGAFPKERIHLINEQEGRLGVASSLEELADELLAFSNVGTVFVKFFNIYR